jgi:hypothetical protein
MIRSAFVLALGAATYVFLGLWSLVRPEQVAGMADLGLASATARTDFLAVYGGFELGFGLFLAWCLRRTDRRAVGLVALGMALLGMALGRLLGLVTADGPVHPLETAILVSELAGVLLCAWGLRSVGGVVARP